MSTCTAAQVVTRGRGKSEYTAVWWRAGREGCVTRVMRSRERWQCEVWVARFEGELSMDASCMRGGMLGGAWQGAGGGAVRGAGEDAPPSSRVRRTALRSEVPRQVSQSSPST